VGNWQKGLVTMIVGFPFWTFFILFLLEIILLLSFGWAFSKSVYLTDTKTAPMIKARMRVFNERLKIESDPIERVRLKAMVKALRWVLRVGG
jgi:hypothetical protein